MILETSAAVAIVMAEPGCEILVKKMAGAATVAISAVSYMEASTVLLTRLGASGWDILDDLLVEAGVEIVPVDVLQARIARDAHAKYGKGRKHPARLNLGDCFSYALAKQRNEPLLFVGNDFIHTDVLRA